MDEPRRSSIYSIQLGADGKPLTGRNHEDDNKEGGEAKETGDTRAAASSKKGVYGKRMKAAEVPPSTPQPPEQATNRTAISPPPKSSSKAAASAKKTKKSHKKKRSTAHKKPGGTRLKGCGGCPELAAPVHQLCHQCDNRKKSPAKQTCNPYCGVYKTCLILGPDPRLSLDDGMKVLQGLNALRCNICWRNDIVEVLAK